MQGRWIVTLTATTMDDPKRKVVYTTDATLDIPYVMVYPVEEGIAHTASVIFLHGLGDTAKNFLYSMDPLVNNPKLAHVKFIFPSAPRMNLTAANNRITNSWFDCYSFDHVNRDEDEEGLFKSVKLVNSIMEIEESQHNIPSSRIIIGGISQGGAVSILSSMTTEKPIAGLFALSTYIPLRKKIKEIATPMSRQIPIFWGHGKEDTQVDYAVWKSLARTYADDLGIAFNDLPNTGEPALKALKRKKAEGMWFLSYPWLEHWMNQEELGDLGEWMRYLLLDESEKIAFMEQDTKMDVDG